MTTYKPRRTSEEKSPGRGVKTKETNSCRLSSLNPRQLFSASRERDSQPTTKRRKVPEEKRQVGLYKGTHPWGWLPLGGTSGIKISKKGREPFVAQGNAVE